MTDIEVQDFIDKRKWTFAKTMPWCPHFYTVRKGKDDELFCQFAMHIRENGYEKKWCNYLHTYFDVGEWYYWTMGNPIAETTIINRAKLSEWSRYEDKECSH